jgi:hypothetical protein
VAALLHNLAHAGVRDYWCEIWSPDETGELIDSAFPAPDAASIECESDILRDAEPS